MAQTHPLSISRTCEIANKHYQNRTIGGTSCKKLMPRCSCQQTHCSAKQQGEHNEHADGIERVVVVIINGRRRHCAVVLGEVGNGRGAGEMVQGNDRDDEENEDDKSNENVDEFVDARGAV